MAPSLRRYRQFFVVHSYTWRVHKNMKAVINVPKVQISHQLILFLLLENIS